MASKTKQDRRISNVLPKRRSPVTAPRQVARVGRNEPCPCGSGKKYKDCHFSQGDAYLKELALEQQREQLKAERERLKAAGVPWYKRLFLRA
ncbi:MAG TPA: SEC-C metal-binding domain-containing protein [Thermoanaerobaculia bacterium]|nr:SEC-C metal-binding domain-containing protein [Thermoanaerobaculia bacterium]